MTNRGRRIGGLLDGGDYACSHAYAGGLAQVCCELAELVDRSQATRATTIAVLAPADLAQASRLWFELSTELRRPTAAAVA